MNLNAVLYGPRRVPCGVQWCLCLIYAIEETLMWDCMSRSVGSEMLGTERTLAPVIHNMHPCMHEHTYTHASQRASTHTERARTSNALIQSD